MDFASTRIQAAKCRHRYLTDGLGEVRRDRNEWGGPPVELKKILKKPETNCGAASFLLLPSHRSYGIFGMGFP
jgi:hypothetical protein